MDTYEEILPNVVDKACAEMVVFSIDRDIIHCLACFHLTELFGLDCRVSPM